MTVETRTVINLVDILRVEIECRSCRHRWTAMVKSFYGSMVACPNCNNSWRAIHDDLEKLAKALNVLYTFSESVQELIHVQLEIASTPTPK